jgi:hypothetical protein
MARPTLLAQYPFSRSPNLVRENFLTFLLRQMRRPWFWLLYLVTFTIYLLYGWRGWLRTRIYWEIR